MKAITDDPIGFFESGGWTFLDPESGSDGEGDDHGEEEEDEAYEPTDMESDEEFVLKPFFVKQFISFTDFISIRFCRSDDESEYSEASEDETEDSEDLGSEEESGKDWSDLEREAAEDDANYSNRGEDSYVQKKKSSHDRRDKNKSSKNHR